MFDLIFTALALILALLFVVLLITAIVALAIVWAYFLESVFKESREKKFRELLREKGYSETEIKDAVQNFLNKRVGE